MGEGERPGGATPEHQAALKYPPGGSDHELADKPEEETRLSPQELKELEERQKARMADPNYRNTLIPPPDELLRALKRQANR